MKRKFFKMMTMVMAFALMFCVTALTTQAAESNITSDAYDYDGSISEDMTVTYTDRAGQTSRITFDATCTYTVAWYEGSYGWVLDAVFALSNQKLDGTPCQLSKVYAGSHKSGSDAYMDYLVNSASMYIRVEITCDEWGDVTIGAYEISSSALCNNSTCNICH